MRGSTKLTVVRNSLNAMPVYPQLGSGALSQFPVRKIRRARTVVNQAADGSTIKLADPLGAVTEWDLTYTDLSDAEASALLAFYAAVEGTLTGFTFLDPAGNLLACERRLERSRLAERSTAQFDRECQRSAGRHAGVETDQWRRSGTSARPNAGGAGCVPLLPERLRAGRNGEQCGADDRQPGDTAGGD